MTKEVRKYAEKRILESNIRMVPGHYPKFESKEQVDSCERSFTGLRKGVRKMPAKRKDSAPQQEKTYLCHICGKEIQGEHVYIQNKRKSKLHIHFECMPGKESKT